MQALLFVLFALYYTIMRFRKLKIGIEEEFNSKGN